MNSTFSSSTLLTSWAQDRNLGFISPLSGKVREFRVSGCPTQYTATYQFALLKGTFTNGSSTTTLTQIGSTISNSMTADRYYTFEEDIDTSINAGDQLIIAARRTSSFSSTYFYLRMVFNIIIEELTVYTVSIRFNGGQGSSNGTAIVNGETKSLPRYSYVDFVYTSDSNSVTIRLNASHDFDGITFSGGSFSPSNPNDFGVDYTFIHTGTSATISYTNTD